MDWRKSERRTSGLQRHHIFCPRRLPVSDFCSRARRPRHSLHLARLGWAKPERAQGELTTTPRTDGGNDRFGWKADVGLDLTRTARDVWRFVGPRALVAAPSQ